MSPPSLPLWPLSRCALNPEPVATQIKREPEPNAAMGDSRQEQDLIEMLIVLRTYLGNRATSTNSICSAFPGLIGAGPRSSDG
jgi:hypothetical protein